MPEMPFFSVIIPTHNRLAMLEETLACVIRQTYPQDRYEIIVIDDGSTDGTAACLDRLSRSGQLRYLTQPNRGPAAARNAGARESRGDVLVFTDDDCLPEAGWLQALAESYAASPPPVAVGGRVENVADRHWLRQFYAAQDCQHRMNNLAAPTFPDTANASFDRVVFLAQGGFNEAFPLPGGEDMEFGYRLTCAGHRLTTNPQAVVRHVGCASLPGFTQRSFRIGYGTAIMMIKHLEYFPETQRKGLRLHAKRFLDYLVRWTARTPPFGRPFLCALAAAFRRAVYDAAGVEIFVRTHLRTQVSRYRAMRLGWSRLLLYFWLEWHGYTMHLMGQVVGTFFYTYDKARA